MRNGSYFAGFVKLGSALEREWKETKNPVIDQDTLEGAVNRNKPAFVTPQFDQIMTAQLAK